MFRWLVRFTENYEEVMVFKNIVIYFGGIFTGILLGMMLVSWLAKNGFRDKDLPEVEIMRIKKGSKTLYVSNVKGFNDTIHGLFIIFGWRLGLIRKNNVYYKDAKKSLIAAYFLVAVAIATILISLNWIIHIVDINGHWF